MNDLVNDNAGTVMTIRPNGSNKDSHVFIKKNYHDLPSSLKAILDEREYTIKLKSKHPKSITSGMLEMLPQQNC